MKHSIEKRDEAIQLRRAGKTAKEISSQTGIGMTTLKGWFREEEINRLPKGKWPTAEEQKAIVNEYLESHSPKAIKEKYGIGKTTLYRWKKNRTVVARTHSGLKYTAADIQKMKRQIKSDTVYRQIVEACNCLPSSPMKERVLEIERLKDRFTIYSLCKVLKVSHESYYRISASLREESKTQFEINDQNLIPRIHYEFKESGERFAAPMIALKLKEKGIIVSKEHVRRLMKQEGLVSKQFRPRCHGNTTCRKYNYRRNRLRRNFTQSKPNAFWVSDITYARVNKEFYAICTILDLFSRKTVGWGIASENNCELVSRTFQQAFEDRGHPEGLTFHSDQGAQYTAYDFRKLLRDLNVRQSLSNPGTPHDNAVAESFFSTFKREELSHNCYHSLEELEKTVADYIDFYNHKRPHRKLKLRTPDQCELEYSRREAKDAE